MARLVYFRILFLMAVLFGLALADVYARGEKCTRCPEKSYCAIDEPCSTHMLLDATSNKSANYFVCYCDFTRNVRRDACFVQLHMLTQ